MNDRFDEQDLTAYALGAFDALDDDKVAAIETAMQADPDVRQEIEMIAKTANSLEAILTDDLGSGLTTDQIANLRQRAKPRFSRGRWWTGGLAAAAATMGVGVWLLKPPPPEPTVSRPPLPVAPKPVLAPYKSAFAPVDGPDVKVTTAAPIALTTSDGAGLALVALVGRGVVEEPLAFTELRLTFHNPEPRTREGRFRIVLPEGARVSRFAMKIGNHWQEGEVLERRRAQKVYEDFLHRRQDPALLEQSAGNVFTARVFPIPANAKKELILSYSQALERKDTPYRIPLRGLPKIERLDIQVHVGGPSHGAAETSLGGTTRTRKTVEVRKTDFSPDRDFTVVPEHTVDRLGLRHDNLVVARITPVPEPRPASVSGVMVLVDTSASRALGLDRQLAHLQALAVSVGAGTGPDTPFAVACFDQDVSLVFEDTAEDLDAEVLEKIRNRGALGASDLGRALDWLNAKTGPRYDRLIVMTDGMATAGRTEGDALVQTVRELRRAEIDRMDVIRFGGIRDEALLTRLVTAGLPEAGVVISGEASYREIARRLSEKTYRDVRVKVDGAAWVWPQTLDGLQSRDSVLVYADLPPGQNFALSLEGVMLSVNDLTLVSTERPLLERAWVGARIERLLHQRDTLAPGDKDLRAALRKQVVDLSVKHRVLSPFTALLVLETEADYRRFGIERNALSDILTVDASGLAVDGRTASSIPRLPVTGKTRATRRSSDTGRFTERNEMDRESGAGVTMSELAMDGMSVDRGANVGDEGFRDSTTAVPEAPPPETAASLPPVDPGFGSVGDARIPTVEIDPPEFEKRPATRRRARRKSGSRSRARRSSPPTVRLDMDDDDLLSPNTGSSRSPRQLNDSDILGVIRKNRQDVKRCLDHHDEDRQGRVTVKLTIQRSGRPKNVRVLPQSWARTTLGRCLVTSVKRWRFPRFSGPPMPLDFPVAVRERGRRAGRRISYPRSPDTVSEPPPPEPERIGLDQSTVSRVVRKGQRKLSRCWQRHPVERGGKVTFELTVRPSGQVRPVQIREAQWQGTALGRCMIDIVSTWRFPRFNGPPEYLAVPFIIEAEPGMDAWSPPPPASPPPAPPAPPPPPASPPPAPPPTPPSTRARNPALTGKLARITRLLKRNKIRQARMQAETWRRDHPEDVLALVALGRVYEVQQKPVRAARAYGSIIDLFPDRTDLRRFAGNLLERVDTSAAIDLAADTYEKAVAQRPDHVTGYRLLAYARVRQGQYAAALDALTAGLHQRYPAGRFQNYTTVLRQDVRLVGAAWANAHPDQRPTLDAKLSRLGTTIDEERSVRFVLTWETDANDVDLHIFDPQGNHASYQNMRMPTGGRLFGDVRNGYGPECFVVRSKVARPYRLEAHYYRRGPMGYGMGKLAIVEHDGKGGLKFDDRPFVIMNDDAVVKLGKY